MRQFYSAVSHECRCYSGGHGCERRLLKSSGDDERGTLVAELAIVTPFLLFLIFASLEFSSVLDRYQWASQLSREVANIAYRSCSAKRPPFLQACLRSRVLDRINISSNELTPGIEFIVGAYSYEEIPDPSDDDIFTPDITELRSEGSTNSEFNQYFAEHFSTEVLSEQAEDNIEGSPGVALRRNGVLIVVTAFLPYDQIVLQILPFLRYTTPTTIRASTII